MPSRKYAIAPLIGASHASPTQATIAGPCRLRSTASTVTQAAPVT